MAKTRELLLGGGEHTELLLTVLGMVSASQQLEDRLLAENAEPVLADDDPVVLAALGLVSLRRSLLRWLELAAETHAPADAGDTPLPPEPLR